MFCFFAVYLNAGVPLSLLAFSSNTYWQAGAPLLYLPDGSHLDADAQLKLYYESVSGAFDQPHHPNPIISCPAKGDGLSL